MTASGLRFLAWARRGLGAAVSGAASADGRVVLPVSVQLSRTPAPGGPAQQAQVDVDLRLLGPGDVIGIDPAQVIRTDPSAMTVDFEPNYFPLIEFDQPEYPWLFSPEPSGERVQPWLCLIAVPRDRAELEADARRPLPWIAMNAAHASAELPDLAEAWAWAHVQLAATDAAPGVALTVGPPERTLSRLLCPRQLSPGVRYVACVVPTYRAGVQAGLGQEVFAGAEPAWPPEGGWAAAASPFELPVYWHWEFTTGLSGDFESLVRRIRPRRLGPDIGGHPMDLTTAGAGLPVPPEGTSGSTLSLEGVLTSPASQPSPWPERPRDQFQHHLSELLEGGSTGQAPVPPPIYGSFQAGLPADGPSLAEAPRWLRDLNLDPRYRVAAALGTQVVQELQEQLMASAWDQAGQLEQANAILRRAQLARAVTTAAEEKHLRPLPPDEVLRVTQPVHGRVRLSPRGRPPHDPDPDDSQPHRTLHASVRSSRFPETAISAPFRRGVRPRGPLGRRLPGDSRQPVAELSGKLADGTVEVPIRPARGGVEFDEVGNGLEGNVSRPKLRHAADHLQDAPGWRKVTGTPDEDPVYPRPPPTPDPSGVAPAQQATTVAADRQQPNGDGVLEPPGPGRTRVVGINRRFKEAATFLLEYLPVPVVVGATATDGGVRPPLALGSVADGLVSPKGALDPEATVAQAVLPLLPPAPAAAAAGGADPLQPRRAEIRFPQPMSEPLKALDAGVLLPGVERIEPQSVGILTGNARVIEAYLVGLNHEMSRELLWRRLPTDVGATYFTQFWDARGRGASSTPPADISPIEMWQPARPLGGNATRVGGAGMLMLIIRSELLRRYPTTAIYAVKAEARTQPDGTVRPVPGTLELYPEFRGGLEPDLTYLGFGIGIGEARGAGSDMGWFFVIQEQPTAPRFGVDVPPDGWSGGPAPPNWSELHWAHLAPSGSPAGSTAYVRLAGVLDASSRPVLANRPAPVAAWGTDAAQMAAITFQNPVRMLIHARTLLAPDEVDPALTVTGIERDAGGRLAIRATGPGGVEHHLTVEEAVDELERGELVLFVTEATGARRKVFGDRALDGSPVLTLGDGEPLAAPPET